MPDVRALLSNRDWSPDPPPGDEEVQRFLRTFPKRFPPEYLELLQECDGGEGELALAPRWFVLNSITDTIDRNREEFWTTEYPDLFIIGGNGGLETIAFDTRTEPWQVVMFDAIAGMSSVVVIAPDFSSFLKNVGVPYPDDEELE